MTRFISVTGGKGGVGKTSISLNLALSLAKQGSKVCLFDADLGMANINILLGLYPKYTLEDVIFGDKSMQDVLLRTGLGVDVIPGGSGVQKLAHLERSDLETMTETFAELDDYDYFLFDTAAGISDSVITYSMSSSEVVIVITPEPTSLADAYAVVKVLAKNNYRGQFKVVVNQCKNIKLANHTYNHFRDVVKKFLNVHLKPLGVVKKDERVSESIRKQQPMVTLYPDSSVAMSMEAMASRLISNELETFEQVDVRAFWSKLMDFTKRSLDSASPQAQQLYR